MIAALLAALIVGVGIHTPSIIARPITMVGNITIPAALMIIGSSMARLPIRKMVGDVITFFISTFVTIALFITIKMFIMIPFYRIKK